MDDVQYADWGPDDRLAILKLAETSSPDPGKYLPSALEFPIGSLIHKTEPEGVSHINAKWPHSLTDLRVSGDGRFVACISHETPGGPGQKILLVETSTRRLKVLASGLTLIRGLAWSQDGARLAFAGAHSGGDMDIWDADTAGSLRPHFLLRKQVPLIGLTVQDISRAGDLLVSTLPRMMQGILLYDLSRHSQSLAFSQEREVPQSFSWIGGAEPTRGDSGIAVTELADDGSMIIIATIRDSSATSFLRKMDGTLPSRLDGLIATSFCPRRQLLAGISSVGGNLVLVPVHEPQSRREIELRGLQVEAARWFHDGRRLLVAAKSGAATDLYVVDTQGAVGAQPRLISHHGFEMATGGTSFFCAAISQDDRLVAAMDSDFHIAILSTDGANEQFVPGSAEEQGIPNGLWKKLLFYEPLRWSPDQRHLYVLDGNRTGIELVDVRTGARQTIINLHRADSENLEPEGAEITADGRVCVYTFFSPVQSLYVLKAGSW
jgi:hypothetical protein